MAFAAAFVAALVASLASGLTGFGLALVLVPALLLFYEPATVVPVTLFLGMVTAAAVVWDARREVRPRFVFFLLPFAFVGLAAGSEVLRVASPDPIRLVAGMLVFISALLLARNVRLPGSSTRRGAAVAGLLSGGLSTSVGMAGPPVVLLFAARNLPKRSFRGNISAYFLALNAMALATLFVRGVAGTGDLPLAAALVPAAFAGKALGTALMNRIPEGMFRFVSLGVVSLTGLLGVVTAVRALL